MPLINCDTADIRQRLCKWGIYDRTLTTEKVRLLESADRCIADLEAEVARLEGIVAKLPVTADGVPVVPGMPVWCALREGVVAGTACRETKGRISVKYDELIDLRYGSDVPMMVRESNPALRVVYSTREAAEAAKGGA